MTDQALEQIYAAHGARRFGVVHAGIRVHRIRVAPQHLEAVEQALRQDRRIRFVEKNFLGRGGLTPNDPGYAYQWHLDQISAAAGWDVSTGSSGVSIAVIDSGVDPDHPDLAGKLLPGYNFLSSNTDTHDVLGHGTAVAGTAAAATDDGIGVAGVAWSNPILPLVVLNASDYATYADIASAITYAADHGARVANISIGGASYSSTMQEAANYAWNKGLVVVASAMNNSSSTPYYPAALDHVLAVAATDQADGLASFSSYGTWIALSAPGTSIYTTHNGGGYAYWQGTSFSAPQVAALAALVFSRNPGLTNTQVVSLLENNADDLGGAGFDPSFGWGRINIGRTLQAAASTTAPPSVTITSPGNNSSVSGMVSVAVSASDPAGISRVDLYLDNVLTNSVSVSAYVFDWDTTTLTGSHALTAQAVNTVGQMGTSSDVVVTVVPTDTTPPTVAITGVVSTKNSLSVTTTASDSGSGVVRLELYVDDSLKSTGTRSPWTVKFSTRSWASGSSHTIRAKAYDTAGNAGASTSVTVTK
ncbi:MAG: hypothetical protein A3I00_07970 [Betaproteobacteria bacterium RIFCSPLOWO2_02_FULL_64_12]|nr:MAG: hypothetical protein A3I00_07970 [Betaproteobacteria bacterium RIFCSPLOWO2_02_FULL_64_12]